MLRVYKRQSLTTGAVMLELDVAVYTVLCKLDQTFLYYTLQYYAILYITRLYYKYIMSFRD